MPGLGDGDDETLEQSEPLIQKGEEKADDSGAKTLRQTVCEAVVQQKTDMGQWIEDIMTVLTWAMLVFYITITEPDYEDFKASADTFGLVVTLFSLSLYGMRLWAVVDESPPMYGQSRVSFILSSYGLVDILTLLPYFLAVIGVLPGMESHFHGLQFARVLWLFSRFREGQPCHEAYKALSTVAAGSSWLIYSTLYFLVAIWLIIATCYHITERDNQNVGGRFVNFYESMWWSLVNLMGEYPINTDLSSWGKVVGTVTMVIAIGGVQGIPTGIITDGYFKYMQEQRGECDNDEEDADEAELTLELSTTTELELRGSGIKEDSSAMLDQMYLFINAHTDAGTYFEAFIMLLVVVNVGASTIDSVESYRTDTTWQTFYEILEPLSVTIFTIEYVIRFIAIGAHSKYTSDPVLGRLKWAVTSFFPMVDLLAIVPFYVDLLTDKNSIPATTFIRTLRLLRLFRLFKAAKFVEGMDVLRAVVMDKMEILLSIMYAVLVLWLFFSFGMYYTERNNGQEKVAKEFNTVPRAMWITLLNMTGEYPIGDYTELGRILSTFVAFFAIAAFGIPIAVLADGMSEQFENLDKIKGRNAEPEEEEEEIRPVDTSTALGKLHVFMQGENLIQGDLTVEDPWFEEWGVTFQVGIMALILLNIICYILSTDPNIVPDGGTVDTIFELIETISVIIFTLEYVLRLVSSYGDPAATYYAPFCFVTHMFSFYGIIDMLAICPWYLQQFTGGDTSLVGLRALRLMRLLRFERYVSSFSLLIEVFNKRYYSLMCSFFIMSVSTIVFATLLHHTEKDNLETTGPVHMTMGHRFRSVPSSLFYTFIHLTGDYPLYKYTTAGRIVNFFMIIVAQGLVGIPIGIIVDGFQSVLEDKIEEGQSKFDADQARLEGLSQNDTVKLDDTTKKDADANTEAGSGTGAGGTGAEVDNSEATQDMFSRKYIFSVLNTHWMKKNASLPAQSFNVKQGLMICAAVILSALRTDVYYVKDNTVIVCQYLVAAWFCVEYVLRLYSCPVDPKFEGGEAAAFTGNNWKAWTEIPGGHYICYATDFTGIVDLASWLPFFIAQPFTAGSQEYLLISSIQILCILKLDRVLPAFTLLDDVINADRETCTGRLLICTAVVSMILWLVFAVLFYVIEDNVAEVGGAFDTMPKSLFTTMILIGGEWCMVDLIEPWGELLGVALALVGLGVVGIPISIIFEGYSDISAEYVEKYMTEDEENIGDELKLDTLPSTV